MSRPRKAQEDQVVTLSFCLDREHYEMLRFAVKTLNYKNRSLALGDAISLLSKKAIEVKRNEESCES